MYYVLELDMDVRKVINYYLKTGHILDLALVLVFVLQFDMPFWSWSWLQEFCNLTFSLASKYLVHVE